jgi:transketolase
MAIAEAHLAAEFGRDIIDHRTYVLASDGDLMEGISQEAIALAGHLRLKKLTVLFDDNGMSIDGPLSLADSVDQVKRFEAAGWAAQRIDGHDPDAIAAAIEKAQASDRPSLIACHTTIGFGAPTKAGSEKSHGAPLGADEIKGARESLGWPWPPFEVPSDICSLWRKASERSVPLHRAWTERLAALAPSQRHEFERRMDGRIDAEKLAAAVRGVKQTLAAAPKEIATRVASELALDALMPALPELVSGSGDLTGSNNTKPKGLPVITADHFGGRFIHYGVREHVMAAAMSGMALHGGVIPLSGTFLVFSDYCRPAIRLAALMGQRVIFVMTHDSIGLGEDGPTHQPVEHLSALRAIPNLVVLRPCDAVETAECWQIAIQHSNGPSLLSLTRQNLPQLRQRFEETNRCASGAYEIAPAPDRAQVSLFASGSEVSIALAAQKLLADRGVAARVVSVPSLDLLFCLPEAMRREIIGEPAVKVAIEAGVRQSWDAVIGPEGVFIGMSHFGASAPYKDLYRHFGITPDGVVEAVFDKLAKE